jgi:hypothetical protein
MSNRYAIIENGLVTNVVLADADLASQSGWIECPNAGPGWKYDGTTFTEPDPVPEPEPAPAPTKEQLAAELAALTAKIQALE